MSSTTSPTASAFRELAPGSVRPGGWLRDQLTLQANGLTGRLHEVWPDVGPDSAWLGGDGESWERGPYFLDGLIPLAHALGDADLLATARAWVDAILASQGEDGGFGPASNDDWWPRVVAVKALVQHADATGDERVPVFLERYFRYQATHLPERPLRGWSRVRGNDQVDGILWLHARRGEEWLLELARTVLNQCTDWDRYFREFPYRETAKVRELGHMTHVVNVAMGVKSPAVHYLVDGDAAHRDALESGLANLDRYHGLVHGMFSGDEHLAGTDATRGVELCAVVEMMFSLQILVRTWGSVAHADRLEQIAYNLLPAGMTADMTAHQYHQQANQVLVSVARRDWTAADDDSQTFGLEPNFGCCTANLHQGWPKLLRAMWFETPDGGLAAVVHGPSSVRWDAPTGPVEVTATTTYPFGDAIRYEVIEGSGRFPLLLRVPGWCDAPTVSIGGQSIEASVEGGFLRIDREWSAGDVVELGLPSLPRLIPRPSGGAGVALGSLVLALGPGEIWQRIGGGEVFGEWEIRPRRSWSYALTVDADSVRECRVERREPGPIPFSYREDATSWPPEAALRVWIPTRWLPDWPLVDHSAAPVSPDLLTDGIDYVVKAFVPYGSARLRLAEFPLDPGGRYGLGVNDDVATHWPDEY